MRITGIFPALIAVVVAAAPARAVELSTAAWGAGGLTIGSVKMDMSGVNKVLSKYGYPQVPGKISVIGGVGVGGTGSIGAGGRGFGGMFSKGAGDRYVKMSAGGGGFTPLWGAPRDETYVGIMLTIGGFGFDFKLTRKPEKFPSAEELIDNPSLDSTTHIQGGSFCIGVGLAGYYGNGYSVIGFNVGKLYFGSCEWRSDLGTELADLEGPKSGSYALVDVLFGQFGIDAEE